MDFLVQIVITLLNAIIGGFGFILMMTAIGAMLTPDYYREIGENDYGDKGITSVFFLMTFGLFVLVATFCGIVGTLRRDTFTLVMYSGSLFVVCALQMVYTFFTFNRHREFYHMVGNKTLFDNMSSKIAYYYTESRIQEAFDNIQSKHNCCGVLGPLDYFNGPLPPSCCPGWAPNCNAFKSYQLPCYDVLWHHFEHTSRVITIFSLTAAVIEASCALLCACFASAISTIK